jgi:hypothetical protein
MPLFVIFQPHIPAAAKEPAVFVLPVLSALPLDLSRTSLHQSNDHFKGQQTSVRPFIARRRDALCSIPCCSNASPFSKPFAWLSPVFRRLAGRALRRCGNRFLFCPGRRYGFHFFPAPPQFDIESNHRNDQQRNFRCQDGDVFLFRIINHHTNGPYDKRNGVNG